MIATTVIPTSIRWSVLATLAFMASAGVVAGGMLAGPLPLWSSALPLLAAVGIGTPSARAVAFGAWTMIPAAICAWGFIGLGHSPVLVVPVAMAVFLALGWTAAMIGVGLTTFAVALIPSFPASPLVALADVLPGLGPAALLGVLAALLLTETARNDVWRWAALIVLTLALSIWKAVTPVPAPPEGWTTLTEPAAVSERGRWIAIRDTIRPDTTAILGEAVIQAEDLAAVSFWCRAATDRNLILFIGVTEAERRSDRGAVWRFDSETCADGTAPVPAARAWIGIPGITGGWGPMPKAFTGNSHGLRFLICLEAFLPWAWFRTHLGPDSAAPVVVVSNDSAFGSLPLPQLRRKAATAMAGMLGIPTMHAETGLTILTRNGGY